MDPSLYDYPSPLEGWTGQETLSNDRNPDGKSLINPPATRKSPAYTHFPSPLDNGVRGGFDAHVYFLPSRARETEFATQLHRRIRLEFPELRVYPVQHAPVGPHPVGMFEVNVFTPEQFGAFVPWLVIHRGPLSVLVHPNTGEDERDHTQRATWMGERYPLQLGVWREAARKRQEEKAKEGEGARGGEEDDRRVE